MRIQCWNILRSDTDWTTFYKYINYKCIPTRRETNPKYSKIKAFKLKLLLEELPTLEVLHERNPRKYPNPLCFRCKETTESNYHLLTCKENSISIRCIITETVNKILISHEVYEQNIRQQTITTITKYIGLSSSENNTTRITLGLLPIQKTLQINKLIKKEKNNSSLTTLILHKISSRIYKEIWLTRCQQKATTEIDVIDHRISHHTVSRSITESHNPIVMDQNRTLKLTKWYSLFSQYNTSPNHINTIID